MRIWVLVSLAVSLAPLSLGQPSIKTNGVVNATGYQTKLAPDTVFAVFGDNMGPASIVIASAPNYPSSLAGTSVTFTPAGGGSPVIAKMVYTLASQVAGLLPSSIIPGEYEVRVTYNNQTSAPQTVTVVSRSFGIAAANGGGAGPAQATNGSLNSGLSLVRFTSGALDFGGFHWLLRPAYPGNTLVLWGTGGGADPSNDTGGTSGDQTAAGNFSVSVGGRRIMPLYAGASSGYPGLWQINFTLPADIAPDCFSSVQVSAGGEVSNTVSIAIASPGQGACSDPQLSQAALAKLDAGGDIVGAAFGVAKLTATEAGVTTESASGAVYRYTAAEWAMAHSGPTFDRCTLYDRTYPAGGKDPASPDAALDAGARLPFSGPNLPAGAALASTATATGPVYLFLPTAGTLVSGKYTLTGNGGTQVGSFAASVDFPTSFMVTNWASVTSIDRAQPLTFNWTGSGFDKVFIMASTADRLGSNEHLATVSCYVPAGLGTYSVPAAALAYLSATGPASFGTVSVQAISAPGMFSASLVGGGETDFGVLGANLGVDKSIAVH